jgi:hypothetical protein
MYIQSHLLFLSRQQFTGTLSTGIGRLSELDYLDVVHCEGIGGSLPSEIGLLTKVRVLGLGGTSIEGTIPEELFHLTTLFHLDLGGTQISGTISTNIGLLTLLLSLDLEATEISGTVPEELGLLTTARRLLLNGNSRLSGSIPETFCANQASWSYSQIVVDCTPSQPDGTPAVYCPKSCCDTCCDVQTNICTTN